MPKKQPKKPEYPKEICVRFDPHGFLDSHVEPNELLSVSAKDNEAEVAIYKFDRLAKVKRTVTVE